MKPASQFTKSSLLVADHEEEAGLTKSVLDAIPDGLLTFRGIALGDIPGRSIGEIAWHLVHAIPAIMNRAGMHLSAISNKHQIPDSALIIGTQYQSTIEEFLLELAGWEDSTLAIVDDIYGQQWSRARTLGVLMRHEIHHRAQICLLLRIGAASVPVVYGPTAG